MMISGKSHIYIGEHTIIKEYARIEAIRNYDGTVYRPLLVFGDRVNIEQGVHITCSESLKIGENTTISSYVYISDTSHDCTVPNGSILDHGLITKPVIIGKGVFIGTGVKILPGVSIGNYSIIGANAVVTHNIPDYSIAVGIPARVIKKFNLEV